MIMNDTSHSPVTLTPVLLNLLPFITYPDFQAAAGREGYGAVGRIVHNHRMILS